MTWSDTFLGLLKDNDVRFISYIFVKTHGIAA
jgi:hypothetical protein